MSILRVVILSIVTIGALASCSHYRLGSPGEKIDSLMIWIEPVVMQDSVSGVAISLNRELRESVIRGGHFQMAGSKDHADRILSVVIVRGERESLARSNDTGLSDVIRVELFAEYDLFDSNGECVKTGRVSIDGQVFRSSGFIESSRQRLPSMLRDLADDILQDSILIW